MTALWDCNSVPLLPNSSLSQWVHACDALDLPMLQREELDAFIDQLYKDIEKGELETIPQHLGTRRGSQWALGNPIPPVPCLLPWAGPSLWVAWPIQSSDPLLSAAESGEFLNCEGSGLYVLQSCCK